MSAPESTIKATLSIGSASLAIEGDKDTVNAQVERFYAVFGKNPAVADGQQIGGHDNEKGKVRTAAARARKGSGPSCASRIELLISENFFATSKTPKAVVDKLQERATPYPGKHVAASLGDLTKRGKLRRMKQGDVWLYVNP